MVGSHTVPRSQVFLHERSQETLRYGPSIDNPGISNLNREDPVSSETVNDIDIVQLVSSCEDDGTTVEIVCDI